MLARLLIKFDKPESKLHGPSRNPSPKSPDPEVNSSSGQIVTNVTLNSDSIGSKIRLSNLVCVCFIPIQLCIVLDLGILVSSFK